MLLRRFNGAATGCVALGLLFAACGSDGNGNADGATIADGGADAGPADAGGETSGDAGEVANGPATLAGIITDQLGEPVVGARVEAGGLVTDTDARGQYSIAGLPLGPVMTAVSQPWFHSWTGNVTLVAGMNPNDWMLEEVALEVRAEDRALVQGYVYDWTKQPLSVAIVARPTRRDFDNAVYYRNPALYRDRSAEPMLTPSPAPEIAAGAARNFTFPVASGTRMGMEALELASIADAPKDTPLGASEPAEFMMWTPMINWLSEGDAARSADLRAVGVSVRQQTWGTNTLRPQEIDKVFLDTTGALWARVSFAPFVQVGAGITDDDGDGQKEIYARIPAAAAPADLVEKLRTVYAGKVFTTHGLSKELSRSLNELYSTTMAKLERTIGQPFDIPGIGTVMHPFVVLRHAGDKRNVILVGPGP